MCPQHVTVSGVGPPKGTRCGIIEFESAGCTGGSLDRAHDMAMGGTDYGRYDDYRNSPPCA